VPPLRQDAPERSARNDHRSVETALELFGWDVRLTKSDVISASKNHRNVTVVLGRDTQWCMVAVDGEIYHATPEMEDRLAWVIGKLPT
jgi:hypothetical protein